ncbi:MAG TPA: YcxB family protein [Verrucomicrobiae bacterium]|nr:YcxB family protein [Verrucomicrobiae bacterium]
MEFTGKLNETDMSEVRKMTRSKTYWLNLLLYGAGLIVLALRAWRLSLGFLARTPPDWQAVAMIWAVAAGIILWTVYMVRRGRTRQLTQLNATRPDLMSLTNDGMKFDGPNGATALVPWRNFKGWREGRRIVLVERSEGNRFVMLPVSKLSEIERLPIRQFLQSHIPSVGR